MEPRTARNIDTDEPAADLAAVCTLPPEGLAERLAWVRSELLPHAVAREQLEGGVAFELADRPGVSDAVDRLIALEAACCRSLRFERRSGGPGRVRLEIHGIDPDAAIFRGLAPGAAPPAGARGRLARAAGFGAAASLLVCCALPVAGAALLGAAAAPLAALDGPGPIAAGALAGGFGAWVWLGRRARRGDERKSED